MAKLILIITTVLIVVSIGLGFMNRSKFIELRDTKDANNAVTQTLIAEAEDTITKIEDTKKAIASAEVERDVALEEISSTERKINAAVAKKAAAEQSAKERDLRIAEIEEALKPFDGLTVEGINERIEDMEKEIAMKEDEITNLQSEIEVTQAEVAKNEEAIAGYRSQQTRRSEDIALNSAVATITAVNNDWGFVVVNFGTNKGVEADDTLIVSRGNQKVGQLDIISLEPNMLVGNIVPGSLTAGALLPGDRVIFQAGGSTVSN